MRKRAHLLRGASGSRADSAEARASTAGLVGSCVRNDIESAGTEVLRAGLYGAPRVAADEAGSQSLAEPSNRISSRFTGWSKQVSNTGCEAPNRKHAGS